MSEGRVEKTATGTYRLAGELSFTTVPQVWSRAMALIREDATASDAFRIDLADVERADSAGVALLLEWLREARRRGKRLQLDNMPAQMQSIARVSGLDDLLGTGGDGSA